MNAGFVEQPGSDEAGVAGMGRPPQDLSDKD